MEAWGGGWGGGRGGGLGGITGINTDLFVRGETGMGVIHTC